MYFMEWMMIGKIWWVWKKHIWMKSISNFDKFFREKKLVFILLNFGKFFSEEFSWIFFVYTQKMSHINKNAFETSVVAWYWPVDDEKVYWLSLHSDSLPSEILAVVRTIVVERLVNEFESTIVEVVSDERRFFVLKFSGDRPQMSFLDLMRY